MRRWLFLALGLPVLWLSVGCSKPMTPLGAESATGTGLGPSARSRLKLRLQNAAQRAGSKVRSRLPTSR
jgi:hypothetical protein